MLSRRSPPIYSEHSRTKNIYANCAHARTLYDFISAAKRTAAESRCARVGERNGHNDHNNNNMEFMRLPRKNTLHQKTTSSKLRERVVSRKGFSKS